jgi:dTDP-4-dehydrorhamnose reductase
MLAFTLDLLGQRHSGIKGIGSKEFKRPAKRLAYSVLDSTLFTQRSGYKPVPWQKSLKRFMDSI